MNVLDPHSLRAIRLLQCERLRVLLREQLTQNGWQLVDVETWKHQAGQQEVELVSVPGPDTNRIWRVQVRGGAEVADRPFYASSFGAAVREANRLNEQTSDADDEGLTRLRRRSLAEHYGIERQDPHSLHP